ncbi:uncharacterized protein LOC142344162 isoform X2 [Convolutriloba macropyga]|uniref:uncharacterized protein LOC142344162 isoform X2 n=1 Tax=Convolutriloba macropyga TaxID=536237 RepID=UPI003F5252EE
MSSSETNSITTARSKTILSHRPIQLSSKSNQSIYLEHPMGRKQGDCDGPYQTGAETRFYCLAMNISQDEVAEHWTSVRDRIQKDISRINTLRRDLETAYNTFCSLYHRDRGRIAQCPSNMTDAQNKMREAGSSDEEEKAEKEYESSVSLMIRLMDSITHINKQKSRLMFLSSSLRWKVEELKAALKTQQGFFYEMRGENYSQETIEEAENFLRQFSYYPQE